MFNAQKVSSSPKYMSNIPARVLIPTEENREERYEICKFKLIDSTKNSEEFELKQNSIEKKCSVTLTISNFAVIHAVSDEYIEHLLLLQIISFTKENILPKLSIDIWINLTCFGAMSSRDNQHSLVNISVALQRHDLLEIQQLFPHWISNFIRYTLVDSLVQLLSSRFLFPIFQHLDPLFLALNQNLEFLLQSFLIFLRWCGCFVIVHETKSVNMKLNENFLFHEKGLNGCKTTWVASWNLKCQEVMIITKISSNERAVGGNHKHHILWQRTHWKAEAEA